MFFPLSWKTNLTKGHTPNKKSFDFWNSAWKLLPPEKGDSEARMTNDN